MKSNQSIIYYRVDVRATHRRRPARRTKLKSSLLAILLQVVSCSETPLKFNITLSNETVWQHATRWTWRFRKPSRSCTWTILNQSADKNQTSHLKPCLFFITPRWSQHRRPQKQWLEALMWANQSWICQKENQKWKGFETSQVNKRENTPINYVRTLSQNVKNSLTKHFCTTRFCFWDTSTLSKALKKYTNVQNIEWNCRSQL